MFPKLAESQIYKFKAACAKSVINYQSRGDYFWIPSALMFLPGCILPPTQMGHIYI